MAEWWETFFDADYLRLWEGSEVDGKTDREVAGLFELLGLREGSVILDAPCGYGRISHALAKRGATVVGIDFSTDLLAEAERRRGEVPVERLRYCRADLRTPLQESGFDVALNIFTSLGYGNESDDVAILSSLCGAVRPGGQVFVESIHRDAFAVATARSQNSFASRLPDGTLLIEEPRLDPISGRVNSTWYWSGPGGSGQKTASLRSYSSTELIRLVQAAGLKLCSLHAGCSTEPFVASGPSMTRRLGILALRP